MLSRIMQPIFVLLYYTGFTFAGESSKCLTDAETKAIVADFTTIAALHDGYVEVAKKRLTADFQSISDSVNFVDQIPVRTTNPANHLNFHLTLPS